MPYTHTTLTTLTTQLGSRLGNTIFWTTDELKDYIKESLRTWNSIAQFYRERVTFNTQSGIAFYDLTAVSNDVSNITGGTGNGASNPPALLGYSLQDRNLINSIQYNLIEPITSDWATGWIGTDQFTMDDLTRALERKRNEFLLKIAPHLTHSQVAYAPPPANGRLSLDQNIIQIRRVAWKNLSNSYDALDCLDEWAASSYLTDWETTPGTPKSYATTLAPPVTIQIIPPSNDSGTLDILSINNGTDLNPTNGILLSIPDDYSWIIKFGALADLLGRDSQAYDPLRSQYCEKRYEQGLQIAQTGATINQAAINGNFTLPMDVSDFDAYLPDWQNESGTPKRIAICSRNLIALHPVPNDVFSVQLDILRNMPIPTDASPNIQIGKEDLDSILDYAFHLAMFKTQGTEFEGSYPMLNRFMQAAMLHNDKLRAEALNYDITRELSLKQDIDKSRFETKEN